MDNIVRDVCQECETEEVPVIQVASKDLTHSIASLDKMTKITIQALLRLGYKVYSRVQIASNQIKRNNISTKDTSLSLLLIEKDLVFTICLFHPRKEEAKTLYQSLDENTKNLVISKLVGPVSLKWLNLSSLVNSVKHIDDISPKTIEA